MGPHGQREKGDAQGTWRLLKCGKSDGAIAAPSALRMMVRLQSQPGQIERLTRGRFG